MEAVQETNEPTYCVCQQVSYGEMNEGIGGEHDVVT